jgi:hypothetical protein
MRTPETVQKYLEGVEYPAFPPDLIGVAQDNDAPPNFLKLLRLLSVLPTATEFCHPDEVTEQLDRIKGLG